MILHKEWQNIKDRIAHIKVDADNLDISSTLVKLLIAAEDHRFCSHPGVDLISLCRAIWKTFAHGKKEGGSTIAMQLVRVITGRYERTISRKITEIYFAVRITRLISESDIPRLYLTVAYFGWRMNGLKQVSSRLKINPSSVSVLDAANIIARLKYPEPGQFDENRLKKISERAKYIIGRYEDIYGIQPRSEFSMRENNGSL